MAQSAKWYESCADAAMADTGLEMPTLPTDLAEDITKWGETTFDICRRFGTPTKEIELMMNYFLRALHTSRYCNPEFTHIKHLVHLLFDSLLRAQTKSFPKHTSAPPSSWTWTPSQSSGDGWGAYTTNTTPGTPPPRPKAAPPQPIPPPVRVEVPPQTIPFAAPTQPAAPMVQPTPATNSDVIYAEKGVEWHKDILNVWVTVNCVLCNATYTTKWCWQPYEELQSKE